MMRLDHVMIRTLNMKESIEFYSEVLEMNLENVDSHPDNGYDLAFLKDEESGIKVELTYNYDVGDYEVGDCFGHLSFYADDCKAVLRKAEEHGLETRLKEHTSSFGKKYYIGVIISPEGIEIAIVEKVEI